MHLRPHRDGTKKIHGASAQNRPRNSDLSDSRVRLAGFLRIAISDRFSKRSTEAHALVKYGERQNDV